MWMVRKGSNSDQGITIGPARQHSMVGLRYKIDHCNIKWTSNLGRALGKGGFTGGGSVTSVNSGEVQGEERYPSTSARVA